MPYFKDTLIARRGYSGAMGAWADTVGQIGQGFLTFFGNRGQAAPVTPVVAPESGPSTAAIAVGAAAVGGALWLLLRKK